MINNIRLMVLTVILSAVLTVCYAQEEDPMTRPTPKWVSDKGYWQVESNIKTPDTSVIYFYNNDRVLVYKEKIAGMRVNLKKRRVLLCLRTVLDQSAASWEQRQPLADDSALLARALRR